MKHLIYYFTLVILLLHGTAFKNKETGPWKEKQLIRPEVLAEQINNNDTNLLILNTGPVENIKGAVGFGEVSEGPALEQLEKYLADMPRDRTIVIYCGCCPLSVCPNIEPAYTSLKKYKFRSVKVLRLIDGLAEDWTDKGFPVEAQK